MDEVENKKIQAGDLFDNPEGKWAHCNSCMIMVCFGDIRKGKEDNWYCVELWWDRCGFKGSRDWKPEGTYKQLTANELSDMKYKGNIYDLIKNSVGSCIFNK